MVPSSLAISAVAIFCAALPGMAKNSPWMPLGPCGMSVMLRVLMPTTSPLRVISGPPLLP